MASAGWKIADPPPPEALQPLASDLDGDGELFARLLYNRGVRDRAARDRYLNPSYERLADPFDLPDMPRAVNRVLRAVESGERVGLLGDFDVDGLSATALLMSALRSFGCPVAARIPQRDADGHGIPLSAVDAFAAQGIRLLITVDTGSSEHEAIAYAAEAGIDCIITDHHLLDGAGPPALAVVNPQRAGADADGTELSGAGVAFKLAQAVGRTLHASGAQTAIALASLGTIADLAPMRADSRIITAQGLRELNRTRHSGLASLLAVARSKLGSGPLTAESVAFQIAPRLNAPGRLGDARLSLDLLATEDPVRAHELAQEIDALNSRRQQLSEEAWGAAIDQIQREETMPPLILVSGEGWPSGLLGPLAGRLSARYGRPAVAVTLEGGEARASARSIAGMDIHDALQSSAHLLTKFGGHARAAGFTAPQANFASLSERLKAWAKSSEPPGAPELEVDAEVSFDQLRPDLWAFCEGMAPFGEGNPPPLFVTRGLLPSQVTTTGRSGDHLRLILEREGRRFKAIGFRLGNADLGTGTVDAVYSLRTDYWRGTPRPELDLKAIRPSA